MSEEQEKAKEAILAAKQKEVDAENEKRKTPEGKFPKGTLLRMGQTRGKNPQVITWEAFDETHPETLPKDVGEFMDLVTKDESKLLSYLIEGFNDSQYREASDPIAEYVEASWPEEIQKGFRLAVRNYSVNAVVSIEDAVALIKPGIQKAVDAAKAAKAAEVKPA